MLDVESDDDDDIVVIFKSSESELIACMASLLADSIVGLLGIFEFNGKSGVMLHICMPRGLCVNEMKKQ